MSRVIDASAPGKLVLVGEYAVLDGAPALVASVDVRASARVSDLAGDSHELCLAHSQEKVRFTCAPDGTLRWQSAPGTDAAVIEAVCKVLHNRGCWHEPAESFQISLDSRDFFIAAGRGERQKLGLGSSAAVCVALTAAFGRAMGIAADYATAAAAHRLFQQGHGSGLDVACSFTGGIIEFKRSATGEGTSRSLPWPDDLHVLPVFSGMAASTSQMLKRLADFRQSAESEYERQIADLTASSSYAVTQWESGKTAVILAAIQDYSDQLRSLDSVAAIGIWSEQHQTLGRVAAEANAVYKPSGAGGGDFGLAFHHDAATLAKLADSYREKGFVVPALRFCVDGVQIDER